MIYDYASPKYVIAFDGSYYEAGIRDNLPATTVGYVKVSSILIDMDKFDALRLPDSGFIDPFKVAELKNNNSALTFALPGANVRLKDKANVKDSFRALIDQALYGANTRFDPADPTTSLRSTLFHIAAYRSGALGTAGPTRLSIHKCPTCNQGPVPVLDILGPQFCTFCNSDVYPSDVLRIWEEVSELQSNLAAVNRFMLIVEHLLPFHYVRYLLDNSLPTLAETAFFRDGPLAVFGTSAWLHAATMRYLSEVNARLTAAGQPSVLMLGLQKTGQVVDHAGLITRFIPPNRIYAIEDDYRYQYVVPGRDASTSGFGSETYYGQDFIYKTPSGRVFVLALPYPFASKTEPGINFYSEKVKLGNYPELPRALALIKHFELDLYQNSVVPIALAHRYTAISLMPGGRVLDLLTRKALEDK